MSGPPLLRLVLARLGRNWRAITIGVPLLWLAIFCLIPFLIVLKISLAATANSVPPYTPLLEWAGQGALSLKLHFSNFRLLLHDRLYIIAYLNSLKIAALSTLLCLIIGYPIAYAIARSSGRARSIYLLLIMLPFWSSFLLRIYAWMELLNRSGLINMALMKIGLISAPITMMNTDFAVYLGIVYSYLPFMILPLYVTLEKLDLGLNEAAMDLGSRPARVFLDITLPLSLPGILAGSLLVFIPATGEYVIPTLLGNPTSPMIGRVIFDEFYSNLDWPVASAIAVALLVILIAPIMVLQSRQARAGASAA